MRFNIMFLVQNLFHSKAKVGECDRQTAAEDFPGDDYVLQRTVHRLHLYMIILWVKIAKEEGKKKITSHDLT